MGELREYGKRSHGMACHHDLQMYSNPSADLEFAVTIDNDSESKFTYTDASGKEHVLHTTPNSVTMVRAGAAWHCVSATNGGTRSILKFIYTGSYRKGPDFRNYVSARKCDDSANSQALRMKREGGE